MQMEPYAACETDEIRSSSARIGDLVRTRSGLGCRPTRSGFFANGMLLNVLASMQVMTDPEPWARQLGAAARNLTTPFFHEEEVRTHKQTHLMIWTLAITSGRVVRVSLDKLVVRRPLPVNSGATSTRRSRSLVWT